MMYVFMENKTREDIDSVIVMLPRQKRVTRIIGKFLIIPNKSNDMGWSTTFSGRWSGPRSRRKRKMGA